MLVFQEAARDSPVARLTFDVGMSTCDLRRSLETGDSSTDDDRLARSPTASSRGQSSPRNVAFGEPLTSGFCPHQ
jgi:hypothetical protein